ncbi:NBS-LRR type disease resistance protein [Arachis hypogaea]|uniref:NBS-LRR type disease resistance protein n=1 Tax=Arachis hypogaea TaxID=3818 RepID=A0A6B9V6K7_ARAHY|nr:NBS-LRR type disease resistance protein [Arachis hypogaea]
MKILISLAGKVADYTVGAIGRQFGYIIFYKAHFKELSDRVTDLEGKRDETKHHVQNERRDLKKIEGRVLKWLDDADEAIGTASAKNLGFWFGIFTALLQRDNWRR